MKKSYFLMILMAIVAAIPAARAEVITNYTESFADLDVSDHSFKPLGWGHIVESYEAGDYWSSETYYVEYTNPTTGGYSDDGAYLSIGTQTIGTYDDTNEVNDMLVTPALTGTVSLYVKLNSTSGSIKFYTCTKGSDGSYTAGDEITANAYTLSADEWTQVTISGLDGVQVGIRGDNVSIDNLVAEQANMEYTKALTIGTVTNTGGTDIDANADGYATMKFSVAVTNSGEVPLTAGTDGYSLDIVRYSDGGVVSESPVAITQDLAVGASATIEMEATVAVTENSRLRYDIKENISSTTKFGAWIELYPYTIDYELRDADGNTVDDGTTLSFGSSKSDVSLTYTIRNDGAKAMAVSSISVPTGFSVSVDGDTSTAFTVAAHSTASLTVTMLSSTVGSRSGNIVITGDDLGEKSYPVSGTIIDPNASYITFDDGVFPDGTYLEPSSSATTNWTIANYSQSDYGYCAQNSIADPAQKFVLPKLHFAAGETLSFDAAKRASNSTLTVYYSSDRSTWTQLTAITTDSSDDATCFSSDTYSSYSSWQTYYKYKTFSVTMPEGDYYVAFESGYAYVDNIVGGTALAVADVDLFMASYTLPSTGTVNHAATGSFIVSNVGKLIETGTVNVNVLIDGAQIASYSLSILAVGGSENFSFSFTPRTAGESTITVQLVPAAGGDALITISAPITIAAEEASGERQVGTYINTSSTYGPITNYRNTLTETIYPADDINLPAGTKITSIKYKGYYSSTKELSYDIKVWIANEEGTTLKGYDLDGMTLIGDYTLDLSTPVGSSTERDVIISVDIPDGFEYTGNNLRIITSAMSSDYTSIYFEYASLSGASQLKRHDNTSYTSPDDFDAGVSSWISSTRMPIVYLYYDKEATTLSGTVTDGASPIEGAEVKIVSSNVEYSGTTATDGTYSFPVYQDTLDYTFTVTKDGYFTHEETINLNETSLVKDVTLTDNSGFQLQSVSYPETGEVNSTLTVTASVLNGAAKEAGSYTAILYVDGEAAAEAEAVALAESATADFSFSYTPHAAGSIEAYVAFSTAAGTTFAFDPATITIAEESAEATVQVGTNSIVSSTGPLVMSYQSSMTETIYPAEIISLESGQKIISVEYKGYYSSKDVTFNINMWIANEEGTTFKGYDTEGMTQIATDYSYSTAESVGSSSEHAAILHFDIPDGFEYTGGNIRIVATSESSSWTSVNFEVDGNYGSVSQYRRNDVSTIEEITQSWQTNSAMPVVYFGVEPTKTLSGTVTNTGNGKGVPGASLTLKSGDVEYYAETDADGNYSLDVIKHSLDYTLTATAWGFLDYTDSSVISFADGDVTRDFQMTGDPQELVITGTASLKSEDIVTVIPNATVELLNNSTRVGTAVTNSEGVYTIEGWQFLVYGDFYVDIVEPTEHWYTHSPVPIDFYTAVDGVVTVDITVSPDSGVASLEADGMKIVGGKGCVKLTAPAAARVRVYNAAGMLLRDINVERGQTVIDGLTPGFYVVNNVKVIVR